MRKYTIALIAFAAIGTLSISSCNKTDNGGPCIGFVSWALAVQDESAALSAAAAAYGADPTVANCEAYKQAYVEYIDALDAQRSCVPGAQKAAYEQSLDQARTEANAINC